MTSSTQNPQGKFWMFTHNNPIPELWTSNDVTLTFHYLRETHEKFKINYASWQLESGEEGTPHIQGYIELDSRVRRRQLGKTLTSTHLELRKGSATQAKQYTTKEDTRIEGPWEFGTFCDVPNQTKPLELIKRKLDEGVKEKQIAEEHFCTWIRHHKAFQRYKQLISPNRDWATKIIICIGPTGCGKSRFALEADPAAYWKQRSPWWCGYEGQDTVVLDEFYGWIRYDELLRLCDRYPLLVETKGGQTTFLAKTVIITSNTTPDTWYRNVPNTLAPLYRRVTKWRIYSRLNEFTEYDSYESYVASGID